MKFQITIDQPDIEQKFKTSSVIKSFVIRGSNELRVELSRNSPKGDTKFLYASWYIEEVGNAQRNIYSDVKYSKWVNDGTGIYGPYHHKIVPRKASVLVFSVRGRTIFAKSVKGQKGQKFVEKSIDNVKDKLDEMFAWALKQNFGGV